MNSSLRKLKLQHGDLLLISKLLKHERVSAFFISLCIMFLAQSYIGSESFVGDAYAYWHYSSTIFDLSFPHTMRGYFYPFVLAVPRYLSDKIPVFGLLPYYIFQASIFALTLTITIPYIFIKLIGGEATLLRRLLPSMLVGIFFPGLIAYPLSDLPALCMSFSAIALILLAANRANIIRTFMMLFLAGVLAYGAYSTRTIYVFTFVLLMPAIMLILNKTSYALRLFLVSTFIFGASIAAIPQILINYKHQGVPSPLVLTDNNNTSLYANQLKWGVTIQRYETGYNPETLSIYPIYYLDPDGERLFNVHHMADEKTTVTGFLRTLASDPFPFLGIYVRHLINGLDVRDDDPYTRIPSKERDIRSLASLSISVFGLFLLLRVIIRAETSATPWQRIMVRVAWILLVVLPVIAITPGAVETRFFLPLHIMAYCGVAFGFSRQAIKSAARWRHLLVVVVYVVTVSLFYASAHSAIQRPVNDIPDEYFN